MKLSHLDFRRRFLAALPTFPPELELRLNEFIQFHFTTLHLLDEEDATLLLASGLPRDASPFLSFEAYSLRQIESRLETFGISQSYFPLGHTGSGDVLAIDLKTREVVYFNHDRDNNRVLINSSLLQFLECLCVYQEHLAQGTMASCLAEIAKIDRRATLDGTMWQAEVANEISNE